VLNVSLSTIDNGLRDFYEIFLGEMVYCLGHPEKAVGGAGSPASQKHVLHASRAASCSIGQTRGVHAASKFNSRFTGGVTDKTNGISRGGCSIRKAVQTALRYGARDPVSGVGPGQNYRRRERQNGK